MSLTIWDNFPRRPEFTFTDKLICVSKGVEIFRLVSGIYKERIKGGFTNKDCKETEIEFSFFDSKIYKNKDEEIMMA